MIEKVKNPQHHKKGGELKYYKMYDKENGAFIQYVRHRGSIKTLRNSCYKYIEIKDEKLIAKIKEYKSKAVALKRLEEQSLIREFGYYNKKEFKKKFIINVSRET